MADIKQMYLHVLVNQESAKWQRILRQNSHKERESAYQLNISTFGKSSAAFLATRTLKFMSVTKKIENKNAQEMLRCNFFVDVLMTGSNQEGTFEAAVEELESKLKQAGMVLRKFVTN
jgi:hypothetical protein